MGFVCVSDYAPPLTLCTSIKTMVFYTNNQWVRIPYTEVLGKAEMPIIIYLCMDNTALLSSYRGAVKIKSGPLWF